MNQLQMDLGPSPTPRGVAWIRSGGVYGNCGARYSMTVNGQPTGFFVQHCGHPTAIRPYYVQTTNDLVLARKHRLLNDAKGVCLAAYREGRP